MRMSIRCHECYLRQAIMELERSGLEENDITQAMNAVHEALTRIDHRGTPTSAAFMVHRAIENITGPIDPYLELKNESTDKMVRIEKKLKERIKAADDPLKEAALIAVAGNVVDYGAKNLLDLGETLDRAEKTGFTIDHFDLFLEKLKGAREIIYILDNSGEVVLDRLFMEEIIRKVPGVHIKTLVKKDPILNDVTKKDALRSGLGDLKGVDITEQEKSGWISVEDLSRMDAPDLIISKGQGNFEGLNEYPGIFLLFIVKCEVVAEFTGASVGDMLFMSNGII